MYVCVHVCMCVYIYIYIYSTSNNSDNFKLWNLEETDAKSA